MVSIPLGGRAIAGPQPKNLRVNVGKLPLSLFLSSFPQGNKCQDLSSVIFISIKVRGHQGSSRPTLGSWGKRWS